MSINHDIVKRIIKELANVYPERITEGALSKKTGRPSIRDELFYANEKGWVNKRINDDAWRATAKGIDASEITEAKNIPCTEISV